MEKKNIPEYLQEVARGFQLSRIFLTAFELEIFSYIPIEGITSEEISEKIHTDKRATDRLMNCLVGMDLLYKKNGSFYNTELSERYLNSYSPDFMRGLLHSAAMWHTWSHMTETIKTGKPKKCEEIAKRDNSWAEGFIAAMHHRGMKQAPVAVSMIELENVNSIIDVGGGSGVFSMAFVKAKKNIKATVFDLPNIIPLTTRYIQAEKMEEQISVIEGDYNLNDFGKNQYDLVFLSAVIHINDFEGNLALIKKCFAALTENGKIVIEDFIMEEDRVGPFRGAVFAMNMLVGTSSGDTYTFREVCSWFSSVGIQNVEKKNTPYGTTLIIGMK